MTEAAARRNVEAMVRAAIRSTRSACTPAQWRRIRPAAAAFFRLYVQLWLAARVRGLRVVFDTASRYAEPSSSTRKKRLSLGEIDLNSAVIYLDPEHWFDAWTLAHEIGHWDADRSDTRSGRKRSHDGIEAEADRRAKQIVLRILRPAERALLRKEIEANFKPVRAKRNP